MSDWQPISTAKKDRTWVLLRGGKLDHYWDDDHRETPPPVVCAQWREGDPGCWQFAYYDGGYYGEYIDPKEWMPVPT